MEQANEQQYDADGDRILDNRKLTVLEKMQAEEARNSHEQNTFKKQKNFKGSCAFIADPSEIAFRDFTIGKPHFLVLTLTNVSDEKNSFNVLPLPEKIRNYFEVEYNPKGRISPGLKCEIRFKFLPQLNEDIFSQFTIKAETGFISYPIVCTSRKTIVRCASPVVDFGRIIFGESKKARLSIKNEGSLPSAFHFANANGSEIGSGNSQQEKTVLENLQFQHRSEIDGNKEKIITFQYRPTEIGFFELNLLLSVKNVLHSPPILVHFQGECVQVPVRIQKETYDFQICLLGHIYRQKLKFYNNSQGPMSFKMTQPPQTKKYFQFNPVVGYIQKQASLDIWVKFTADKDIVIYLSKFMEDKNNYRIPFQMTVKEQLLPVDFSVQFRITSDRLSIRPAELNFGRIFEGLSSKIEVELENESELPQEILLNLKKNVTIENDQPLLKLLPLQTIKTHLIFNSNRLTDAKNYREEDRISCKVITGEIATSQLQLHYVCEVTRPDLSLTQNKIDMPALQVGEIVQAATLIRNNTNKDLIFEIFMPDYEACGLKVTPVVKNLPAKQEIEVSVEYHSFFKTLSPALLKKIADKSKPKVEVEEKKPEEPVAEKKDGKKEAKKETKLTKQQQEQLELQQKRLQEQQRQRKEREEQQRLQMQRNFDGESQLTKMGGKLFTFGQTQHYRWLLPIYFKQKDYSDVSAQVNFLQVTTTSIAEVLSIDCREVDFGEIAVGSRAVRDISITNKGECAQLKKKNMPIFCSFNVLNSLKEIMQGGTFKAVIEFQPIEEQRFQQRLEFYTEKYSVSCMLKGKGVRPEVTIQPQNGLIPMGGVLLDEYCEKTIKIKNICNFQINFMLQKVGTGINNSNSSSAFSYVPSNGAIPAHGTIDIKVRFKPDRISEKYYQKVKVHVQEQKDVKYFYISASCYSRQAYLTSYRPNLMPSDEEVRRKAEYAFDSLRIKDENQIYGPSNKTIVLEYPRSEEKTTQKKLVIGSCRLLDNKLEKPTTFEIVLPKDDRFQCDNPKGVAAPGAETIVTFTYKAEDADPLITSIPALAGMGQWRQLKGELKFSGGFVKPGGVDALSFELILRFYVSQL